MHTQFFISMRCIILASFYNAVLERVHNGMSTALYMAAVLVYPHRVEQLLTSGIPKYSASTILSLFSLSAANK